MRVPVDWLREHCSPDLTTDALAEVARGLVDGHVLAQPLVRDPHPNCSRKRRSFS